MAKFGLVNGTSEMDDKTYATFEEACVAANAASEADPDTTVTVVCLMREYTSEVKVSFKDIE